MLTIKHIVNKQERLVQAVSVWFNPETGELTGHGTPQGDITFTSGHVFVMGDGGKTVGAYNLDSK